MAASMLASRLSNLCLSTPCARESARHIAPSGGATSVSPLSRQQFSKSLHGTPLAFGGARQSLGSVRDNSRRPAPLAAYQEVSEGEQEAEEESPEELAAAYEKIYGKPFAGLKEEETRGAGGDDEEEEEDPGRRRGRGARGGGRDSDQDSRGGGGRGRKQDPEFEERVVQVRRVTKVVKGGKQMAFRAVVIIGDKKGRVGVGVGKAKEVTVAVQKSVVDAKRHMITVPMTKYLTFPHRAQGRFGAATVMLRPAAPGTGVIAGGSVRVVLELAGVENALGKELGSGNPLNNARAVLEACVGMKQFRDVAAKRKIPMEELWK